jgi:hypothetical protein
LKDGIEALGPEGDAAWLKASMSHRDHIVLPWINLVEASTRPAMSCVVIKAEKFGIAPQYFKFGDAGSSLPATLMVCRFYRELELAFKRDAAEWMIQALCGPFDRIPELVQAQPNLFGPGRNAATLSWLKDLLQTSE